MTMATKQDIFRTHCASYRHGSKHERGEILSAVCRVTGITRKGATRHFNILLRRSSDWEDQRGGRVRYGPDATVALKDIWKLAGCICAERLHGRVALYVQQLEKARRWEHAAETTALLCVMSLGTMKDRIAQFDHRGLRRGRGTTKPSSIKEIVPVRHGPWNNPLPGFGEIDTVAHCGDVIAGDFCYTVQYTDVTTIWTALSAQWNKGERATLASIKHIEAHLPFALKGLDPDSGGEFINWHLVGWAHAHIPRVVLTRSRPYMKNDHARIEQKNYVNVRRFVGYARFDSPAFVRVLNELYEMLEDYLNFFIPSVMCTAKERHPQQRTKRIYDKPQTAYERVLAREDILEEVKERLREKYATLSMVELKQHIDSLTKKLATMKQGLR